MIRASKPGSEPAVGPEPVPGRSAASPRRWPLGLGVTVALLGLTACVAPTNRPVSNRGALGPEARTAVADGVRLYEAGEYAMAARRFETGASLADQFGDLPLSWRATAAECTSWLLARQLREFDGCSQRLENIQARNHESSSGTNALIAMGAMAGGRPQPAVNVPRAIRRVMRPSQERLR